MSFLISDSLIALIEAFYYEQQCNRLTFFYIILVISDLPIDLIEAFYCEFRCYQVVPILSFKREGII